MRRTEQFFRVCIFLLFLLFPLVTRAAEKTAILTVSPSAVESKVGDEITFALYLNTGGQAISAVDITVNVPSLLRYVKSDMSNSEFPAEVTPLAANDATLHFARTRLDGGYAGDHGLVAVMTFSVLTTGIGNLSIDESNSQVITYSDSSNILKIAYPSSISIPATLAATTKPLPTSRPMTKAVATLTPSPLAEPTLSPLTSPVQKHNSVWLPASPIAVISNTVWIWLAYLCLAGIFIVGSYATWKHYGAPIVAKKRKHAT